MATRRPLRSRPLDLVYFGFFMVSLPLGSFQIYFTISIDTHPCHTIDRQPTYLSYMGCTCPSATLLPFLCGNLWGPFFYGRDGTSSWWLYLDQDSRLSRGVSAGIFYRRSPAHLTTQLHRFFQIPVFVIAGRKLWQGMRALSSLHWTRSDPCLQILLHLTHTCCSSFMVSLLLRLGCLS